MLLRLSLCRPTNLPLASSASFSVDMEVAGLVVAGEGVLALGNVLDRAAELSRGDAEQHEIRIEAVARAKAAADVPVHDAQFLALDAEHVGEVGAQMHRAAAACGVERELVAAGIVVGDRGARLHVHAGDAMGPGAEFCDMRSIAERRVGRGEIAEFGVDRDVGSVLGPNAMTVVCSIASTACATDGSGS